MSFLRPEARAALVRWREAIAALALGLFGLWIALRPGLLLPGFGWVLVAISLGLGFVAARRALVPRGGSGPGIVELREGRIFYLGPYDGGSVALDDLIELALDGAGADRHWSLREEGAPALDIPVNARGADALFDTFTRLPGLSAARMLRAMNSAEPGRIVLWREHDQTALPPRP